MYVILLFIPLKYYVDFNHTIKEIELVVTIISTIENQINWQSVKKAIKIVDILKL